MTQTWNPKTCCEWSESLSWKFRIVLDSFSLLSYRSNPSVNPLTSIFRIHSRFFSPIPLLPLWFQPPSLLTWITPNTFLSGLLLLLLPLMYVLNTITTVILLNKADHTIYSQKPNLSLLYFSFISYHHWIHLFTIMDNTLSNCLSTSYVNHKEVWASLCSLVYPKCLEHHWHMVSTQKILCEGVNR